jgi:L-lactate dehydrogenase
MKVAIIGAGNVGATLAYTLLVRGAAHTVSLIDVNQEKAIGEVADMRHGISFTGNADIRAEGFEGVRDADVIVLTAGRGRRPDESRLDLAKANVRIMEEILEAIQPHYDGSVVMVVSNPMDVLTYVTCQRMGIPRHRVFGSGTTLDSSRFRSLLGQEFDIDPRNIHAYVIGEHGDSSVLLWSMASLGQISLTEYAPPGRGPLTAADMIRIHDEVINAGKAVIQRKGATFYAIALAVCRILQAIGGNERSVFTVSSYIEDFYGISDVCLSLPAVITREGIRDLLPVRLKEDELAALKHSADVLKRTLREIGY